MNPNTNPKRGPAPEAPSTNVEALARFGRLASVGHSVESVFTDVAEVLSAIQGRCDLALRAQDGVPTDDIRDARALAARCANMLRRVSSYARGNPTRWSSSLEDVCARAEGFLALQRREMLLRFYLTEDVRLACPPTQLQQVLQNLILYLHEAVGEGGGRISVRAHQHERYATISVAHDGPGLAEDVRVRLFEPFATPQGTGPGLTLFIARTIVEAHRGFLGYFSTVERGTTFHVVLPRAGLDSVGEHAQGDCATIRPQGIGAGESRRS